MPKVGKKSYSSAQIIKNIWSSMIFSFLLDKHQGTCQASVIFSRICSLKNPDYHFNLQYKDWLAALSLGLPGFCCSKTETGLKGG